MPVTAPCRVTHLAFTIGEGDSDPLAHVKLLCDALGVKPPADGAPHHTAEIAGGQIKYERHGEFYRISVVAEGGPDKGEALVLLPIGWVDGLPGQRLVGIHTRIMAPDEPGPDEASLISMFGHEDLAGSVTSSGLATVWTDFRIGPDGYTRMLVHDHGLSPLRLGRVVRRIHEIETYRMMALLALPMARRVQGELAVLERAVSKVTADMLSTQESQEDARATPHAAEPHRARRGGNLQPDELPLRGGARLCGARRQAHHGAWRAEGDELPAHRRLPRPPLWPAMATCTATAERLRSLAERSERASNLLRTRVDIALEAQNQQLLKSMEKRGHQQLRLQETVEGLSVVAISYYLIGIVSKLPKASGGYANSMRSC